MDYTGTGNTLNMRHPRVLQLIMDSLRYWVLEMHVDGFRFDLASALARELHEVNRLGAFFDIIAQDPVLSQVKLIAEPWDLGEGGYQVGNFPAGWTEWNDRYRDAVRAYWKGDGGLIGEFARRLTGSSDLYESGGRKPHASINFVTAHDGFTLQDLVSYNDKHNDANQEGNRDGNNNNLSWNCGVEGPTDDAAVNALRGLQKRNFLATLLLSQGVPMLLAGDEIGFRRNRNNNAYCQDNETSWLDWALVEKHADLHRFLTMLVARRLLRPLDAENQRESLCQLLREAKRSWHGVKLNQPDWTPSSHSLAITVEVVKDVRLFHMIFNAYWEPLNFELPPLDQRYGPVWRRWIDTSLDSPDDIAPWDSAPELASPTYQAEARSTVVLFADLIRF
jgi:glycogen operon protein